MAITNPALEDGFDLNGSNLVALAQSLIDDGYVSNEIPKSGNINTVFKELYRAVQFQKETGVWQWDSSLSYQKYSRIMRAGVIYKSLSDANQGNDPLSTIGSFWEIDMWMMQTTTHNFTADANYTLTADQNSYGRIVLTDTGVLLTAPRNLITDNIQKSFIVQNDTLQDKTVKTLAGTGILILAGATADLYNDGTNIINMMGLVDGVTYVDPDAVGANPTAKIYPDGTVVGSTDNGSYTKYPNGDLECWGNNDAPTISTTAEYAGLYPVEFVGDFPKMTCYLLASSYTKRMFPWYGVQSLTNVVARFSSFDTGAVTGTGIASWNAKGRWK